MVVMWVSINDFSPLYFFKIHMTKQKGNHHILRFLKYINANDSEHVSMCIIIPKKEYRGISKTKR